MGPPWGRGGAGYAWPCLWVPCLSHRTLGFFSIKKFRAAGLYPSPVTKSGEPHALDLATGWGLSIRSLDHSQLNIMPPFVPFRYG